jgi:hypothetical protein
MQIFYNVKEVALTSNGNGDVPWSSDDPVRSVIG